MIRKNIEKEERKKRRLPPIPFTRKTPTLVEKENRIRNKHKDKMI